MNKYDAQAETLPLMVLFDTCNVTVRGLEQRLLRLNLGVAQQRILAAVYLAKERLTPSMLASILLQEPHSISGLLNRLEQRGLVTRTRNRTDRRVVWVGITPAGRKAAEESLEILVSLGRELSAAFVDQEAQDDLVHILEQTRDACFKIAGVAEATRAEALRRLWG